MTAGDSTGQRGTAASEGEDSDTRGCYSEHQWQANGGTTERDYATGSFRGTGHIASDYCPNIMTAALPLATNISNAII